MAAMLSSIAAFLAESPEENNITYEFERTEIDGGTIELTADAPTATFAVNIHATDLGPDGVVSTEQPTAFISGTLSGQDLPQGISPDVEVTLSAVGVPETSTTRTFTNFSKTQPFKFTGDCADPSNGSCAAHLVLVAKRSDGGKAGGTMKVAWHFDLQSSGYRDVGDQDSGMKGPFDPPWLVEVEQQ